MGVGAGFYINQPTIDIASGTFTTGAEQGYNPIGGVAVPNQDVLDVLHGPYESIAEYIKDHPGLTGEEYLAYMAKNSDEYAEQYMNYLIEKDQIAAANQYNASREDSAYQRLVADLKSAGLNPAMMYGSSASPQAGGSVGYVRQSDGANSRSVSNRTKLANAILAVFLYQLKEQKLISDNIFKTFDSVTDLFKLAFM